MAVGKVYRPQYLPPVGKQNRYSPQVLTYIQPLKGDPPLGADRLEASSRLRSTIFPGRSRSSAGTAGAGTRSCTTRSLSPACPAEEARLETAERPTKPIALSSVISWRIFFVTVAAGLAKRDAAPDRVLTFAEITALDQIDPSRTRPRLQRRTFAAYLSRIVISPANMAVRRGIIRLRDIAFGISIGSSDDVSDSPCWITFHCRGTTSSVSVISSPSLRSR